MASRVVIYLMWLLLLGICVSIVGLCVNADKVYREQQAIWKQLCMPDRLVWKFEDHGKSFVICAPMNTEPKDFVFKEVK